MLQAVRNNDILFGKVAAHNQLSHLVINKISHVAMVTTSKNPKWRSSAQVSDFMPFLKNFPKQLKIITNMNFQRQTTEFVT